MAFRLRPLARPLVPSAVTPVRCLAAGRRRARAGRGIPPRVKPGSGLFGRRGRPRGLGPARLSPWLARAGYKTFGQFF